MFTDFKIVEGRPLTVQVKEYLKQWITKGKGRVDQKLPSTRELSTMLGISRNTLVTVYSELEEEGFIYTVHSKGSFVSRVGIASVPSWSLDWRQRLNDTAQKAIDYDLMKRDLRGEKGMINFASIAPDEKLFDLANVKRAFLDRMALEGEILLNYGYAKGYKPLIQYLTGYMETKGVDMEGKDILITNGFTEAYDIILSSLQVPCKHILTENPTHHTAIKISRLHGYDLTGIPMEQDGVRLDLLERALNEREFGLAYLTPSYHNPTGIVMSAEKRVEVLRLLAERRIPLIEDGFNEELRYSGSHMAPLAAFGGEGNGIIYLGSFSKILFPGIRIGWIAADRELIDALVSVKRSRNIHTSTLDQAVLFQYFHNGNFEKYLKRAKSEYKRKHELAVRYCTEFIPCKRVTGSGGLHLFIELPEALNAREILADCYKQGVVYTAGDVFYTDGGGANTLRLGFSRVSDDELRRGTEIIGREVTKRMEALR
ncbi:PLP-dependent aminotransferase family protein [Paenibacillus sp. VCA1]|uniref:aminotransferase-like domain-containing protein n=1 Tax=Paenibacillus sp. VCA1 TaxID=3039148 RepID=UPI002871DF98|nr:PLP-dependent aminotransferase family protein [Paenibacillus sp. VCA1]MDR9855141.1 PLP-dependent aminotransferase family protein [Paenibacillus sp. VCA1]